MRISIYGKELADKHFFIFAHLEAYLCMQALCASHCPFDTIESFTVGSIGDMQDHLTDRGFDQELFAVNVPFR